jgi:bacillithiol biosynthesis cysteine-adding enzyme BshC
VTIRFETSPLGAASAGDIAASARAQKGRKPDARVAAALIAEGAAAAPRDLLMKGGALAVTTGQQAGLFTGPLYGVLKGLSAAALAAELTARGTPHVPVFWVAGDDHDFAEINHCDVIGNDGRPVRIVLRERPQGAAMLPAYREIVGTDARRALTELESQLPEGDFRTDALAWLTRAYGDAATNLAEAYARALAEVLGPFGVVVARGWDGALKSAAAPVLLGAARKAAELDQALAAEAERLKKAGVGAPVEVGQGLSLLMVETAEGRDRLKVAPGGFETRRGRHAMLLKDIEQMIAGSPDKISGNVLLRPAVEAAVFPTVAYFGGPGELAYLAQTGPVFELLGVPRPARLPRLSGFLVEAKVDKVLERYGLTPADFAVPEGALMSRLAREQLPAEAADALAALRASITERYATLQAEAAKVDKTLEKPVENARNQALVASNEIEKKLVAALKRANETTVQQVARARDQLYPGGEPQERVITAASFLARHGRDLLGQLFEAARAHAKRLLEGATRGA